MDLVLTTNRTRPNMKFALCLSLFALTVATHAAPVRVAAGMHVTTINEVGASIILRSVDSSGKYGPAFCTMATNGSTCVATQVNSSLACNAKAVVSFAHL